MTTTTNSRPTHRIFAVTKNGNKKFWQPIGALWAHADGKGFNQRLDYLPLNDAEIVVRAVEEDAKADDKAGRSVSAPTNSARAQWADEAVRGFMTRTGSDLEDCLCDLLADLMHWADKCEFDFAAALDRASDHYAAEGAEGRVL
jgi:hypothetical protein